MSRSQDRQTICANKIHEDFSYYKQFALKLTNGNIADAEDLLSETTVKALLQYGFHVRNFRSWFSRILYTTFIDMYRKKKSLASYTTLYNTIKLNDEMPYTHVNLPKLLDMLKPREKRIIELSYIKECTHNEIAECVGIRSRTVSVILHRTLKKMRKLLNTRSFL